MKILLFDIESAPNLSYTWGKYEQNVLSFEREGYMLCYAYKWYNETSTKVVSLTDFPLYEKEPTNDRELVKSLHALFNEADIIIAHNGDSFDIKYANGRFLVHGLQPPTTYQTIDTLKIARQNFKLNSNKLDDLGKVLGIGRKVETGGFELWLGCMAGDYKSWKLMRRYNKQDVDLLNDVYDRLKAWKKNHPSIIADQDAERPRCIVCGSEHLEKAGFEFKGGAKKQRWKCKDCGKNLYTNVKGLLPLKGA